MFIGFLLLQLRDPTLRRHILIQFLIVIQLLLKGKKGLFGPSAIPITSSMTTELETLKQRVLSCLGQTPPDGIKCRDAIVHILNREVYWMRWKVRVFMHKVMCCLSIANVAQDAGCVAVEREPLSDIPTDVGGELAKSSKTAQPLHWASLGSSVDVMTALANPSSGVTLSLGRVYPFLL